ncbi:MFS transporter [Limobrevibacterium gyesilva]|uniref:MFS transporter n=1 Tax=Limobrevibacterium gyesilva TaxID=2991712 RepID=A0AA41YSF4_9PROT|nr:MFS transporter [Limobrevibacterium gyesilva]MCW3474627.1 MFS transporter [Limobrevibacterium gyesilva]
MPRDTLPGTTPGTNTPAQISALIAGSVTLSLALGTRATFGLFLVPLADMGVPLATVAFAIAVHNLTWGIGQPVAGAWADRHGATRAQVLGGLLYAAGFALPALLPATWSVMLGIGVLTGFGTAFIGWGVALAGVARAFPVERRSSATGLASAGGSVGQMLLLPVAAAAIAWGGAPAGLLAMAAFVLLAVPLGRPLDRAALEKPAPRRSISAVRSALGDRTFVLVSLGFFTCGFQLAFLATHLPGYLSLCGMPAATGAWALMLVGGANILGSYLCGRAGQRLPPHLCLAAIYIIRAVAILAFYLAPKTGLTTAAFAIVMGLLWLGTVPLTTGVIARRFGVGDIGALFGVCFISHQIGGFLGAWLGGIAFAETGTYDMAFLATAASGLVAAAFNIPIRLPRTAMAAS